MFLDLNKISKHDLHRDDQAGSYGSDISLISANVRYISEPGKTT